MDSINWIGKRSFRLILGVYHFNYALIKVNIYLVGMPYLFQSLTLCFELLK